MASVEELVARTLTGDAVGWRLLQAAVEPTITAMTRRHPALRARKLSSLPDDVAEVVTASLERLARSDFSNLRRFRERLEGQEGSPSWSEAGFDDWLYGTVDYVIREHLRNRFGRAPKNVTPGDQVLPSKRDLQTHAGRLDDEALDRSLLRTLGMTAKLTAGEIFAHIERDFSTEEVTAMRQYYLDDQSFETIAQTLGLVDAKAAERLIRKLNARVRYRFVDAPSKRETGGA